MVLSAAVILHGVWFEAGSLGCDSRAAAVTDFDQCSDRADLVVALYLTAAFLLAGSALGFVSSRAGRLRAARRVR